MPTNREAIAREAAEKIAAKIKQCGIEFDELEQIILAGDVPPEQGGKE